MAKSLFITYLEYVPVRLLLFLLQIAPRALAIAFGRFLGFLTYYLVASARKVSLINLDLVFGDSISSREKKRIALAATKNTIQTFLELLILPGYSREEILRITNEDTYAKLEKLLARGKGVIVVSTHMSNWYWPAIYTGAQGHPVYAVDRPLDNRLLDCKMNAVVNAKNLFLIPRSRSVRPSIKTLKQGGILALVIDQNAAVGGTFIPWFGIPASTMMGVPFMHKVNGSPVVLVHERRLKGGRREIVFSDEIVMGPDDITNMKNIHRYYEALIRKYPEHYFWMHPRWKKRPEGEESYYRGLRV